MAQQAAAEAARVKEMSASLEQEREKRVAHLQQVAARRIGQMGLARGWSGWHGMWEEKKRRENMLRAAGARLRRPKLAASLAHWKHDWDAERVAALEAAAASTLEGRLAAQAS